MRENSWATGIDLESFVGQMTDSIMISDPGGRIVMVNDAFERLTGYSAKEAIGQTRELLSSGVHPQEVFTEMEDTLRAGQPFRFILTNRRKNGEFYQEGTVVSPMCDTGGALVFSVSLSRAIIQTRTTYDNFTLLAEASPVAVFLLRDEKICFANEQFARDTGYSRGELIGKSWKRLVASEDWASVRRYARSMLKGADQTTHEHRIRTKNRSLRWVLESIRPVHISGFGEAGYQQGRQPFVSATFVDITAQKETERDLAQALALYTATAESTTDGIIIIGTDRRILGHNQRFIEMWGLENIEQGANAEALYVTALSRLKDPEGYQQRWAQAHADPSVEASDVVELLDGRTFEVYSKPLVTGGTPTGRVWSWRDVSAQRELAEQLRHQAFHDSLTGLSNRAHFMDRLEHAIARGRRSRASVFVLFLDLDDFKSVNDRFGHLTGDRALAVIARRIAESLRTEDSVARLGGDEFSVLLESLNGLDEAVKVAERILAAIRVPVFLEDREIVLEASVGVVEGTRDSVADVLIGNADVAMYAAKAQGKGRVHVYEKGMHRHVAERQILIADLRHALARNELVVHYQPGIELKTGRMVAAEALVRWNHPSKGLLSPDQFIHLAEETGMIGTIGEFVMAEACRVMADWQSRFPDSFLIMGVNVSARQLNDNDFGASIKLAFEREAVDPHRMLLEITESAVIEDPDRGVKALHELKKLGVSLALDDFGTGYSSLSYLKDLPIDVLKIDRTFIDNIASSPKESLLTGATVALGHQLGLRIVAEGIERPEQLEKLIELQCEFGQGFLFSPPLSREGLDEFVGKRQHYLGIRAA